MTDGPDLVREFNAAVERRDLPAIARRTHPDLVWSHNVGVGTPEEGVYAGRASVIALFERILEPWDYLRPVPRELQDVGGGVFMIRGDLHAKHGATATEIVTPYEQRIEVRDGLLVKGEMVTGAGSRLAEPEPQ
jgi:ketosteroid isomerase-like protein